MSLTSYVNSPQDHALLEAAYQRNSKPDKNERIEIVGQVALGEKEVQVRAFFAGVNTYSSLHLQNTFQSSRQ